MPRRIKRLLKAAYGNFRSHNIRASSKGLLLLMSGIALPLAVIMNFASSFASDKLLADLVGKTGSDYFKMYLVSD